MIDTEFKRSKRVRSQNMASIRSSNTQPEILLRKALFALGYRYRVNCKHLTGKPDIVFPSRRKIIFVSGCFWHQHGCSRTALPKTNVEYWLPKLQRNIRRDAGVNAQLEALGWQVLTIWECETKNLEAAIRPLSDFLGPPMLKKNS